VLVAIERLLDLLLKQTLQDLYLLILNKEMLHLEHLLQILF